MSRWEQDQKIDVHIDPTTLELMLSASDVIAWLRGRAVACALDPKLAYESPGLMRAADALADGWLDMSRSILDGSSS